MFLVSCCWAASRVADTELARFARSWAMTLVSLCRRKVGKSPLHSAAVDVTPTAALCSGDFPTFLRQSETSVMAQLLANLASSVSATRDAAQQQLTRNITDAGGSCYTAFAPYC